LTQDLFFKAIATLKEFEKAEAKLASAGRSLDGIHPLQLASVLAATNLSFLYFLVRRLADDHRD
jgi:hypothetical protein